ncbi:hypothetical protein GQ53DRAFT_869211 [Thozetella sp. PMI_491]|nr:hypothetical protein GQ53DRAFT_869211 [Thozetella sp. PMI_491]
MPCAHFIPQEDENAEWMRRTAGMHVSVYPDSDSEVACASLLCPRLRDPELTDAAPPSPLKMMQHTTNSLDIDSETARGSGDMWLIDRKRGGRLRLLVENVERPLSLADETLGRLGHRCLWAQGGSGAGTAKMNLICLRARGVLTHDGGERPGTTATRYVRLQSYLQYGASERGKGRSFFEDEELLIRDVLYNARPVSASKPVGNLIFNAYNG